jgi:hypothetical protein
LFERAGPCPVNAEHRGAFRRLSPVRVLLRGGSVDDFVWTWYSECLIQDRVLQLFRDAGLRGYEVKPAHARFRKPSRPVPKLWELVVLGWGGMARPESGVRLTSMCPGCGDMEYQGFTDATHLIDENQWDGSDFFMVWPYPVYKFVSDRVADLVRREKLTGVQVKDLPSLNVGRTVRGASPGALTDWMPDARAKQLGQPLGIYLPSCPAPPDSQKTVGS